MDTRLFHISDVLTVTTGRMLSTRGIDGVYDILNFMTHDNLFTHQLPRAMDECRPYLLRQYPALNDIDMREIDALTTQSIAATTLKDLLDKWVEEQSQRLDIPIMLNVEQIPSNAHEIKGPIEEFIEMRGRKLDVSE